MIIFVLNVSIGRYIDLNTCCSKTVKTFKSDLKYNEIKSISEWNKFNYRLYVFWLTLQFILQLIESFNSELCLILCKRFWFHEIFRILQS